MADTSIVPPSLWRDHTDPEVRAFFRGTVLNPRSLAYAEGRLKGPEMNPERAAE